MPSIEIVCIDQEEPLAFGDLPFAIASESSLRSHRGPVPLFDGDFADLSGCIYHLGNPACGDPTYEGPFFAYELLDDADNPLVTLRFAADHLPALRALLRRLLESSPAKRILFTTDWQFGPPEVSRGSFSTLDEFWAAHDGGELRLNGAYHVGRDS